MTDEEIKLAVDEAANKDVDVGAKYGLTKKDGNMTPEEMKLASDDMDKQTNKEFTSDRMKQFGRFLNAPFMSTINEFATPDYDKERYTEEAMGVRKDEDKAKDAARDIAYGAGTVTSDALINAAISKLMGKMGLGPSTVDEREAKKAANKKDKSFLKKYNRQTTINKNIHLPLKQTDNAFIAEIVGEQADEMLKLKLYNRDNEILQLSMQRNIDHTYPKSLEVAGAFSHSTKPGTAGEYMKGHALKQVVKDVANNIGNRDEAILDALTAGKYAKKGLDANKEYQNRSIKDPNRKHGFISSIMDSINLSQLKDNSDKIDIERVKKEMPVGKLTDSQKKEFQDFIDSGDSKGLQEWLLSADVQNSLQK